MNSAPPSAGPTPQTRQFASDNYSGICPEAMAYTLKANADDAAAYGNDPWTQRAADGFRDLFETNCDVYFAFNGTAANSLALAALCHSYHSVICHELAHIETDECGGPEYASNGAKLLLGSGDLGRLTPASVEALITRRSDIHYPRPRALSLTQATELGTLYRADEIEALAAVAHRHQLRVHMDGARFANAVAALGCSPADLTWRAGVDVLCFCGTKNGLSVGEAILFFDRSLAEDFAYRCKQAGQLASKMRFISAPWLGLLESGAWLENARHANAMAAYFEAQLTAIDGVSLRFPRQANALFVEMPPPLEAYLKGQGWLFYNFIGVDCVRLMCAWNTTQAAIDQFIGDLRQGAASLERSP